MKRDDNGYKMRLECSELRVIGRERMKARGRMASGQGTREEKKLTTIIKAFR